MQKSTRTAVLMCAVAALIGVVSVPTRADSESDSTDRVLARGGGTTIVEGGTGSPGFVPVLTKLGFHAERKNGAVTGAFECLALAPGAATGPGSGQFTVNAMYVTGTVRTAVVRGDTATLTGMATITGLGAGMNVPYTFVVREGGPGATAVLTTQGTTQLVFRETLLEGVFQVH